VNQTLSVGVLEILVLFARKVVLSGLMGLTNVRFLRLMVSVKRWIYMKVEEKEQQIMSLLEKFKEALDDLNVGYDVSVRVTDGRSRYGFDWLIPEK
jgi:hypothetical protein